MTPDQFLSFFEEFLLTHRTWNNEYEFTWKKRSLSKGTYRFIKSEWRIPPCEHMENTMAVASECGNVVKKGEFYFVYTPKQYPCNVDRLWKYVYEQTQWAKSTETKDLYQQYPTVFHETCKGRITVFMDMLSQEFSGLRRLRGLETNVENLFLL
jgi:hypothetical protein